MSLYDIVEYVNDEVRNWSDDTDCKLAFTTNSACISVASEMCEVLVSYKETPPDAVMIDQLIYEIERRDLILFEQRTALMKLKEELNEHD